MFLQHFSTNAHVIMEKVSVLNVNKTHDDGSFYILTNIGRQGVRTSITVNLDIAFFTGWLKEPKEP